MRRFMAQPPLERKVRAMVETKTRTVFLSTLKGRHYLTKSGAVKAEARALIEAKHPTERPEFDDNGYMTYPGWHWSMLDRSNVLLRRVCRLVRNGPNAELRGRPLADGPA